MSSPGAGPGAARLDPKRANTVLLILSAMALMVTYVETMVIPAIIRFDTFFDFPPISTVAWILSAYLVVGVAATPVFGKLGDIYGKKRMLVIVIAVYSVAVTLAGFTPEIATLLGISRANAIYLLIAVRGVQGLGMAMFPLAFAMIGEEFPPAKIATAQGIVSAMFAAGAAIGLFGGAYLTDRFGWQFTYHTVVPFSFLLLLLTIVVLQESRSRLEARIDIPGAALLASSLAVALVAISEGPYWGWGTLDHPVGSGLSLGVPELLGLSVLLAALFLYWEPRSKSPIVDFARLKERNIWVANAVAVIAGSAMFLVFVSNSIYAQLPYVGLDLSVLQFGYLALPAALSMMVLGPIIGRNVGRIGPKPVMIVGSLVVAAGGCLLAAFHSTSLELSIGTIPPMVGVIALFIAMTNIIVLSSQRKETGIQTGMNATFRTLGQSLGPVLAATITASFSTVVAIQVGVTQGGQPVYVDKAFPANIGFEYVYLVVALLGILAAALSMLLQNFRIDASGVRVDDVAKGARPTAPAVAPSGVPSASTR
ncbi:MAG: MFS transporter [Thermoplasmata archaeon]|nr:MFS transporter [Thermoplasmata archaeon]